LKHRRALLKNLGYTIQYLQYLNHILEAKELHGTVTTLTQKHFIIGAMGVIEAILWATLKSNGAHKTEEWEKLRDLKCNEFYDGGHRRRIRVVVEEKASSPKDVDMTLEWMLSKVEKRKLMGVGTQVYKDLNHLRGLRNRVHIQLIESDKDTDWWNFKRSDVDLMKKALLSILTCSLFTASHGAESVVKFLRGGDA